MRIDFLVVAEYESSIKMFQFASTIRFQIIDNRLDKLENVGLFVVMTAIIIEKKRKFPKVCYFLADTLQISFYVLF